MRKKGTSFTALVAYGHRHWLTCLSTRSTDADDLPHLQCRYVDLSHHTREGVSVLHKNSFGASGEERPIRRSLWRGFRKRCPGCGKGLIFGRYLKPVSACDNCGEPFGHIRTDDFAPWLTILILGHILLPVLGTIDYYFTPKLWIILLIAISLGTALSLLLLPYAKGFCLGLMWALRLKSCELHSGGEDG